MNHSRPHRRLLPSSVLLIISFLVCVGCAEFDPAVLGTVLGSPADTAPLDEGTVSNGLKEALRIGSGRAIDTVSRPNGFWANELIRIRLPEEAQEMANLLRQVGFSRQVDNLEVAMNRAAEQASAEARDVFVDVITGMTIADAFGILRGGDSAATDYLRLRTSDTLRQRFEPIIQNKMEHLGLYRSYNQLADTYNALPLSQRPVVRLDAYLTDRALDGLFTTLADEERKIRQDPIARTTELLRRVFSRR